MLLFVFFAALVFALEAVAAFAFQGHGFGYFQECAGGVRQVRVFAVDEAKLSLQLQFAHRDSYQFSSAQFGLDADLRDQRDSMSHGDELLDGLQRGQFQVHVQRGFVALNSWMTFSR